jgi:hypothetical protein
MTFFLNLTKGFYIYELSIVHAVLCTIFSFFVVLTGSMYKFNIWNSNIYLLLDLVFHFNYFIENPSSFIHHLLFIIGNIYILKTTSKDKIIIYTKLMGLSEVSTVFLNLHRMSTTPDNFIYRFICLKLGLSMGLFFSFTFIFFRIICGGILLFPNIVKFYINKEYLESGLLLSFYALQLYWLGNIFGY